MTHINLKDDSRTKMTLGPVERWFVGATGASLLAGSFWLVSSVQSMLTQQELTTQQLATMQQQLQTINVQLADVPTMKLELARLSIRADQHDKDIHELKQRGSK